MEELYFCRHGQTEDLKNNIRSRPDTKLTAKGWREAMDAGELLIARGIQPDLIVCSGLPRTIQSAEAIAQVIGYNLEHILRQPLLNECDWGMATGMHNDEWLRLWPGGIETVPGVETTERLQQRAVHCVAWLKTLRARKVLLVGHGTLARSIARVFEGRPYTDEFKDGGESGRFKNGDLVRFYPQPTTQILAGV